MTNNDIRIKFGNTIKNLRKSYNMTQTELAHKLGVTQSTIVAIEKGQRNVPLSMLEKFADIFQTSADILLDTHSENDLDSRDIETGHKIQNLREAKNLTRLELSNELGITVSSLANFESGISTVPIEVLIKYANYFNVSIDSLVGVRVRSEDNTELAFLTQNPKSLERFKKWSNEVGVETFNDEELEELISFAKYLKSKRK